MSDTNMEVAYRWAILLGHSMDLSQQTRSDHERLVNIVTAIQETCMTNEFNHDRSVFRENMGRLPLSTEEPYVLQQFYTYNLQRRQRLFDCIANAIQHLLAVGYNERVSVGLTLWSACIATAKTLDNRRQYSEVQLTEIVNTLKERAEADAIYRTGQEIGCLYMVRVDERQFINFERFSENSAARKYQSICHQNSQAEKLNPYGEGHFYMNALRSAFAPKRRIA